MFGGVDIAAVEGDALFDNAKILRRVFHQLHIGGVGLGRAPAPHWEANGAIVDPHLIADLAAEQLVDRHARGLAGDIPERHLDCADGAAPGLEAAHAADFKHYPLDVGWVFAEDVFFIEH